MMNFKKIIIISLLFFLVIDCFAQKKDSSDLQIGIVSGKDTLVKRQIKEILVLPKQKFKNWRQEKKYWKYAYKVKKVYPYAKLTNELLEKYGPVYDELETNREKRKLVKKVEHELLWKYKDKFKKFTFSEGKIFIKLVDRETEHTPYILIRDFRGGFAAFFWQSMARLFGNDLKNEYDPEGEDKYIEDIVKMIEAGYI